MKHIEVVAAIIERDGQYFATQKGYGEFKGGWEFPGGKIEAGESKELTLVLTKTMTESNTGLVNNTAEIAEAYNSLNVQDTDSTPGNRQSKEDDMGSADLIISVKTGAMVSYVALTLFLITVVAIGAYIMSKKILKKKNMKM